MRWTGCVRWKNSDTTSWDDLFSIMEPLQPSSHQVSCGNETIPNGTKHNETHQNLSLCSNGAERVRSLSKIPTRLRGHELFSLIAPVQPKLLRVLCRNDPKRTQTLRNAQKHEFRFQWGGSGVFVAKMSGATSWAELFH